MLNNEGVQTAGRANEVLVTGLGENGRAGNPTANAQNGFKMIDNALEHGDPIIVGVDYQGGSPNYDKMTDHFIVISSKTEKLIRKYVTKKSKHHLVNQSDGCPIIYQNFDKYVRQYYGIFNKKGQKILEVNFLWRDSKFIEEWKIKGITILDGCSYFWHISVNMKKKKCFNYSVNGIG
jgi:hypothetical protein